MKIYTKSFLILGSLISALARDVKFSVISFGQNVQLNINGNLVPMTKDNVAPLWSTTTSVPDGSVTYKYVSDGVEDLERTLAAGATTTYNEMLNRAETVKDLLQFDYPVPDNEPWTKSIGRTKLFDDSYIPTFVFSGYGSFFTGTPRSQTFENLVVILKDEVLTFSGVKSSGKNYDEDKFQFNIQLPGTGIYERNFLKLRPSSYDPVFFRQMMYGDILHTIGCPTHESIAIRVYQDNGVGIGLYVLQEDVTSESYIRSAFFGDEATGAVDRNAVVGKIYDCATGADFNSNPEQNNALGGFISSEGVADTKVDLLDAITKVHTADVNNEAAVNNVDDNFLDLDVILKALAVEYLAGHWDSYWFMTSNFVTYHPPYETEGIQYSYTKYKYYFVDQDFDQTWGIGMKKELDPVNYPRKSYKEYMGLAWPNLYEEAMDNSPTRVIVDKYIGCDQPQNKDATCPSKTLFESHLKNIVKYIFNPNALGKRIDSYAARLRPEVMWDTEEVQRQHTGTVRQFNFKVADFDGNINSGQYLGSTTCWGLKDWTQTIADTVCNEFGINYNDAGLVTDDGKKVEGGEVFGGANSVNPKLIISVLFALGLVLLF